MENKIKYFICSDIHGFYSILRQELKKKRFSLKNPNHILVICGDLFDRGDEAIELLNFIYDLYKQNRLIFVKGNHETCFQKCLNSLLNYEDIPNYHMHNKTLNTIAQLCGLDEYFLLLKFYTKNQLKNNANIKKVLELIKHTVYYYEINNKYLLVHGSIPRDNIKDISKVTKKDWEAAMWFNGIEDWHNGIRYKDKTIICGHFHTSFGHYNYHHIGNGEFSNACFDIFKDKQIIALDACTVHSKKINILVISEKDTV